MTKTTFFSLLFALSFNAWSQCPTASFSTNDTVSCTYPFELIVTDLSTNTDTWSWNFGDGSAMSSLQNPSHTYTTEGNFSVELTATNTTSGCIETHIIEIIVDSVDLDFHVEYGGCFNWDSNTGQSQLADYSSEGNNWLWTFGDGNTNSTSHNFVNHTYTDTGYYNVSLTKTNVSGCSATAIIDSGVFIIPTPIGGFTLTSLSGGCSLPDTLVFQDTSIYFGFSPSHVQTVITPWSVIPSSSNMAIDTFIIQSYGNYHFTSGGFLSSHICRDTTQLFIDISPAYEQFDTLNICYNSSYTFNNNILIDSIIADTSYSTTYTSQGCDSLVHTYLRVEPEINTSVVQSNFELFSNNTNVTYQWVDCNNSFTELLGDTNQTFIPQTNGDYALVINGATCPDTSTCFTIEGLGLFDYSLNLNFNVYPNPSNGTFTLNLPNSETSFNIEILDLSGRVLYSSKSTPNTTKIEFNLALSKGVYLVKITSPQGSSKTKRITIE